MHGTLHELFLQLVDSQEVAVSQEAETDSQGVAVSQEAETNTL